MLRRTCNIVAVSLLVAAAYASAAGCVGDEQGLGLDGRTDAGASLDGLAAADAGTSFDAPASSDAASDANSPGDAGADAKSDGGDSGADARCDPSKDFGPGTPLSLNTAEDEESPRLSADESTIFFSARRTVGGVGVYDIYSAPRTGGFASFGPASLVPGVNTASIERFPSVTSDGLFLYALNQPGKYEITVASRANTVTNFGALSLAAVINDSSSNADVYVLPDHSALYFASNRSGNFDLYRPHVLAGLFSPRWQCPAPS